MGEDVALGESTESGLKRLCLSPTAKGRPCRAWAVRGSDPPRCAAHGGAAHGGAAHRGAAHRGAAPRSNAAGDVGQGGTRGQREEDGAQQEHSPGEGSGFYSDDPADVTVDEAIAGLVDKMQRLDRAIDAYESDMMAGGRTNGHLVKLFALYAQGSSRLTNMLRARRALSGTASDGIARAIAHALDELSVEWGVDL